jgi:hypothetical protein
VRPGQGLLKRLAQSGCPFGQHADDLIDLPERCHLRQAEPGAQPRDAAFVPEPRQPEHRLPVTAELMGLFLVPIERRRAVSRPETNKIRSLGTSSMTR